MVIDIYKRPLGVTNKVCTRSLERYLQYVQSVFNIYIQYLHDDDPLIRVKL